MKNKKYSIKGTISTTAKGVGFVDVVTSGKAKDGESVHIEEGLLNCALNGDLVDISVEEKRIGGKLSREGRVVKVLKRAKEHFVGIVKEESGKFIFIPDDEKVYTNFDLINEDAKLMAVKADDKIYVKMIPWLNAEVAPRCKIVRILGQKGNNDVEMESIVLESGFEIDFPADVEKETEVVAKNNQEISPEELSSRKDLRGVLTFTIDPFDAKDFDDAISFRKMNDNEIASLGQTDKNFDEIIKTKKPLYEIGVHIADVSHYVTEGSALDKEATKRGCSIYLVDRTIPMLPEVLSNDLCSLNPGKDKLSFSALFIIDENARIYKRWFGRAVINSDYRFTYESAQGVLDNSPEAILKYSNNN